MSKREEYQAKLAELDEAWLSGTLQEGDHVYNLHTDQGWQKYNQECDKLAGLVTEVMIEESHT